MLGKLSTKPAEPLEQKDSSEKKTASNITSLINPVADLSKNEVTKKPSALISLLDPEEIAANAYAL